MRVVNEELLAEFREARHCGWCQKPLRHAPHVHHIFSKGAGRLDIRVNLIPLGGPADCNCHGATHDGNIEDFSLLAVVAQREGVNQDTIRDVVYRLRRLDKHAEIPPELAKYVDAGSTSRAPKKRKRSWPKGRKLPAGRPLPRGRKLRRE